MIISILTVLSTPVLIFHLPYFLLTFQSDTLMMLPTLSSVIDYVIQIIMVFGVTGMIPILVACRISRTVLYSIIILISTLFVDLPTSLMILLILIPMIEISIILVSVIRNVAEVMGVEPTILSSTS